MLLSAVVYRLVTDEAFRLGFKTNPEQALVAAGLNLNLQEVEALRSIPWNTALSDLIRPNALFGEIGPEWGGCQSNPCPIQLGLSATG